MGGITRALFGGSKSKSTETSNNKSYDTLLGLLKPNIGQGNTAMSVLGSLLGIGDPAAGKQALTNFQNATGFQSLLDTGRNAITGSQATSGLFNSGSTGKALERYGQGIAGQSVSDLIGKLTGLGQYGLSSAQTIAGAGQQQSATSTGTSSGGIFNSLFPGGLSDRRAKENIIQVGSLSDGLGVYHFEYKGRPGHTYRGVMADEVERLRPHALGQKVGEYLTVDYSKLPEFPNGMEVVGEAN